VEEAISSPGSRWRGRPARSTSDEEGGRGTHLTPLLASPGLLYLFSPREAPPGTTLPALQLPPGELCHSPWRTGLPRPWPSAKPLHLSSHPYNIT
jgi:hypothetical protein